MTEIRKRGHNHLQTMNPTAQHSNDTATKAQTGPFLVKLDRATVRLSNRVVLHDVSFTLEPGCNWIVLGANGSGKTTLLSLIRGDIWPVHPERSPRIYTSGRRLQSSPLGFREATGWMSADLLRLYHQRQWNLSSLECIASGAFQTARLYRPLSDTLRRRVHDLAQRLDISDLLTRRLLTLSNGQAHKVLLARALVHEPAVLFLDEALAGLDHTSRSMFRDLLSELAGQGTQMIMATHNPRDILDCFDSVLYLENGRVLESGPADHVRLDRGLRRPPLSMQTAHEASDQTRHEQPLVTIAGATIIRQAVPVLRNLSWTIRRGEHWSVTGPNGSGKSTLLRLILGELHPCPGGTVTRFGRHGPMPIWELKTRIGFFSPELQSRHTAPQTVLETLVSGLRGHEGLHQPASAREIRQGQDLLKEHGLGSLEAQAIQSLSNGQQRLVFVLRAMINDPEILLLDEPCSGLDQASRVRLLQSIELLAGGRTQLVMVSHAEEDHPPCINCRLTLDNGRIASMIRS